MVEVMVAENYSVDVIWRYVVVLQDVLNIISLLQVRAGFGKELLYSRWVTQEVLPEPEIKKHFAL